MGHASCFFDTVVPCVAVWLLSRLRVSPVWQLCRSWGLPVPGVYVNLAIEICAGIVPADGARGQGDILTAWMATWLLSQCVGSVFSPGRGSCKLLCSALVRLAMYYHLCSVPVRTGVTAVAKEGKQGSVFSPVGQLQITSSVFSLVGKLISTTQCGGHDCSAEVGEIPSYGLGVDAGCSS